MNAVYKEIETEINYNHNKTNDTVFIQDRDLTTRAVEMLEMWGIYSAYSSKCGHKPVSAMFASMFPQKCYDFVENEIDFIESALLRLKTSKSSKDNDKYRIAELYYKGFDVVVGSFERSQKLTTREIAEIMDMPKSTVYDKVKEVQSYIAAEISSSEYIY